MNIFRLTAIAFAILIVAASRTTAHAAACAPPPGFVDSPYPALNPDAALVSHTEEISFDRPLKVVIAATKRPLKDAIHQSSALPGVRDVYVLTPGEFGGPGSRRVVCLTDGSTLVEQVLKRNETPTSLDFRYVVWNYSTPLARPIEYGIGEFKYNATGADSAHVTWTYSFKLRDDRFPGYLGALGRFLFRKDFLDRQYADMMRATLKGTQAAADSETALSSK